ncbi:twin-arginine translocation signal domain-containing protein [Paenibacillus sp. AR247]|uniref:twin-arginine translocation signal domain-containing protein n=1 Tax=Paenibacillus sp. AR247 TaxID=1631599 RepID=UPI0021577AED|nr:twin-arginine translocation signal domain-containing protein [Paenibacillus sp. AR247]
MAEQQKEQPPSGSRRQFLKYSGTAIGGLVVGGVIGGAITGGFNKKKPAANAPTSPQTGTQPAADYNHATMYFNQRQLQITQAATERIFPRTITVLEPTTWALLTTSTIS